MAFPSTRFPVDLVLWIRAILKGGQGESRDPGLDEMRVFKESGEYNWKGWNNNAWIPANKPFIYVDNNTTTRSVPLIQNGRVTFGAGVAGSVTFTTAYSATPGVVACPDNIADTHVYVKTVTTTGFLIYTTAGGYKQWISVGPA